MSIKRIALLLGVLAAALPLWPAAAASPATLTGSRSIPIGFSIVPGKPLLPGAPPITRRLPRYFQFAVAPGASSSDWVAVVNPSAGPLSVKMGISDVFTQPQNALRSFNDVGPERAVGRWLSLASGDTVVQVPPRSIRLIGLTIDVPSSVPPGEYEGTINGTNQQTNAVKVGQRTVNIQGTIRCMVYFRVTGRASAGLAIGTVGVTHAQGHTLLTMALRNTGTVIDRGGVATVIFKGKPLSQPYTFQVPIDSIMGQASTTLAFVIDHGVPSGAYAVTVSIVYRAQVAESGSPRIMRDAWSGPVVVRQGKGQ